MESRPATSEGAASEPGTTARQRWRLVVARAATAPRLAGRELVDTWEVAVEATGLPLHCPAGRARARVAFGAPLQLGIAAERELADILLTERLPIWRMREALSGGLPAGWSLVDLFDVWVGGPALAGRVSAADYRVELSGDAGGDAVAEAARSLIESTHVPRTRPKREAMVAYDLRPLLIELNVADPGPPPVLRMRTRIHPELGTGRPDEVVAALAERLGKPLEARTIIRERLILADEFG